MPNDLRSVFDTSAVVSAVLLPRSTPRKAFDRTIDQGRVLVSQATVEELNEVLRRKHLNKYLKEDERLQFLATLVRDAELVAITETVNVCRDAKDNKFLELAVSGNASCIVTRDKDLLVLNPFRGILIMTPQEFLKHPW